MVAATSAPTLDARQIQALLDLARRPDSNGRTIDDADWTPTWDLDVAAAEGWRWKAAQVAGSYSFATDGQSFNRSDMVKACQDMARMFAGRVVGSIPYNVGTGVWDVDAAGNVGG